MKGLIWSLLVPFSVVLMIGGVNNNNTLMGMIGGAIMGVFVLVALNNEK